jgi:hypothetical protein
MVTGLCGCTPDFHTEAFTSNANQKDPENQEITVALDSSYLKNQQLSNKIKKLKENLYQLKREEEGWWSGSRDRAPT